MGVLGMVMSVRILKSENTEICKYLRKKLSSLDVALIWNFVLILGFCGLEESEKTFFHFA
jgi:hypothetical protein